MVLVSNISINISFIILGDLVKIFYREDIEVIECRNGLRFGKRTYHRDALGDYAGLIINTIYDRDYEVWDEGDRTP